MNVSPMKAMGEGRVGRVSQAKGAAGSKALWWRRIDIDDWESRQKRSRRGEKIIRVL